MVHIESLCKNRNFFWLNQNILYKLKSDKVDKTDSTRDMEDTDGTSDAYTDDSTQEHEKNKRRMNTGEIKMTRGKTSEKV